MAIFGSNNNYDDLDTLVCEGYDAEVNGSVDAIIESYDDQLAIMEAIHKMDIEELEMKKEGKDDEEIGEVIEGSMSETWERIKKFFTNLFAKIHSWVDTAIMYFTAMFKSGEEFVKKYEKELKELKKNKKLEGYTKKLYKYTNIDTIANMLSKNASDVVIDTSNEFKAKLDAAEKDDTITAATLKIENDEELDKQRGKILNKGSVAAADFSKEVFAFFRDGANDERAKTEKTIDIDNILDQINEVSKLIPGFKALKSSIKTAQSRILSRVDAAASAAKNELKKSDEDSKKKAARITMVANSMTSFTTSMCAIMTTYANGAKSACSEIVREYQSVCIGAFAYAKKADKGNK